MPSILMTCRCQTSLTALTHSLHFFSLMPNRILMFLRSHRVSKALEETRGALKGYTQVPHLEIGTRRMISTTPAFSSFSLSCDVTRLYRPPAAALCMCVFAHARMLFQSRGANILPTEDMSDVHAYTRTKCIF